MSAITPGDLIAVAAITGGGGVAGGITLGVLASKAVRDIVWHRYALRLSAEFRPVPQRHDAAAKAVTVTARKTRPDPEPAALAAVPDAGSVARSEVAALLDVSEKTVRRRAAEWGLEELRWSGRGTRYTAESVRHLLQARNEAA